MNSTNSNFKILTDYVYKLEDNQIYGEWILEDNKMPFVKYNNLVSSFVGDFHSFIENLNYDLKEYINILEKNNLQLNYKTMKNANVDNLNEETILALITGAINSEKVCIGTMLAFFKEGIILKWLKKLKELDKKNPI